MRILIVVSCIIVLVFLFLTMQVPKISENKIEQTINDVQSASEVQIADQKALQDVVMKIVEQLEDNQRTRLKYLVAAYLVIWLVFMLYLLRIGKQQQTLDQRLSQIELDASEDQDESIE